MEYDISMTDPDQDRVSNTKTRLLETDIIFIGKA